MARPIFKKKTKEKQKVLIVLLMGFNTTYRKFPLHCFLLNQGKQKSQPQVLSLISITAPKTVQIKGHLASSSTILFSINQLAQNIKFYEPNLFPLRYCPYRKMECQKILVILLVNFKWMQIWEKMSLKLGIPPP